MLSQGTAPVELAALLGRDEAVQAFISAGIDVNANHPQVNVSNHLVA
jgi:ankyrin repeat protein